jgi:hypothetical protein
LKSVHKEVRADPVTLAAIGLAFITSGTAVAIVNALRAIHSGTHDSKIDYTIKVNNCEYSFSGDKLADKQSNAVLRHIEQILNAGSSAPNPGT